MAAAKLVKNMFVLILFCVQMVHINCMRTSNDNESDTPDAHIMYDQRQSGKYNIHVVIKDVAIIEMDQNEISDQNYNDEDYYYDEDVLTIKPLNIKPTTTSVKPLDYTIENKRTTSSPMQLIDSSTENQTVVTTSKTLQEISSSTLSSNSTRDKELINNVGNLMTLFTTQRPTVDIKSRSKIEPIYAIKEPVLQPRHNLQDFNYGTPVQAENSKIFKVKVHRTNRAPQFKLQRERCHTYQYRDIKGNCRVKRSSSGSILNRLFRMLVTLPFKQDAQQMDE